MNGLGSTNTASIDDKASGNKNNHVDDTLGDDDWNVDYKILDDSPCVEEQKALQDEFAAFVGQQIKPPPAILMRPEETATVLDTATRQPRTPPMQQRMPKPAGDLNDAVDRELTFVLQEKFVRELSPLRIQSSPQQQSIMQSVSSDDHLDNEKRNSGSLVEARSRFLAQLLGARSPLASSEKMKHKPIPLAAHLQASALVEDNKSEVTIGLPQPTSLSPVSLSPVRRSPPTVLGGTALAAQLAALNLLNVNSLNQQRNGLDLSTMPTPNMSRAVSPPISEATVVSTNVMKQPGVGLLHEAQPKRSGSMAEACAMRGALKTPRLPQDMQKDVQSALESLLSTTASLTSSDPTLLRSAATLQRDVARMTTDTSTPPSTSRAIERAENVSKKGDDVDNRRESCSRHYDCHGVGIPSVYLSASKNANNGSPGFFLHASPGVFSSPPTHLTATDSDADTPAYVAAEEEDGLQRTVSTSMTLVVPTNRSAADLSLDTVKPSQEHPIALTGQEQRSRNTSNQLPSVSSKAIAWGISPEATKIHNAELSDTPTPKDGSAARFVCTSLSPSTRTKDIADDGWRPPRRGQYMGAGSPDIRRASTHTTKKFVDAVAPSSWAAVELIKHVADQHAHSDFAAEPHQTVRGVSQLHHTTAEPHVLAQPVPLKQPQSFAFPLAGSPLPSTRVAGLTQTSPHIPSSSTVVATSQSPWRPQAANTTNIPPPYDEPPLRRRDDGGCEQEQFPAIPIPPLRLPSGRLPSSSQSLSQPFSERAMPSLESNAATSPSNMNSARSNLLSPSNADAELSPSRNALKRQRSVTFLTM